MPSSVNDSVPLGANANIGTGSVSVSSDKNNIDPIPVRQAKRRLQLDGALRLVIFNTGSLRVPEVWRELRTCLEGATFDAIYQLKRITRPGFPPRTDMWVNKELGSTLMRRIRENTGDRTPSVMKVMAKGSSTDKRSALHRWRLAIYEPWIDRKKDLVDSVINTPARPSNNTMASWNVNGWHRKKYAIEEFMRKERVAILAVQETLVGLSHYPIKVDGYMTFSRPWQEGFRGQAVLIDSRYPAYEIPREGNHILHVKVSGLPGGEKLHILACYFPSGGNERRTRTRLLTGLRVRTRRILEREPGASVVALGDMNMEPVRIDKELLKSDINSIRRLLPVGSEVSRFPVRGRARALDHMLATARGQARFTKPRVHRNAALSDHRPIVTRIRQAHDISGPPPKKARRFDLVELRRHGKEIVCDNRWKVLPVELMDKVLDEDGDSPGVEQVVTELGAAFSGVTTSLCIQAGAFKEPQEGKRKLPRKLVRLVKRMNELGNNLAMATIDPSSGQDVEALTQKFIRAQDRYEKVRREWDVAQRRKLYTRISDDFMRHDHRNVWRRLNAQTRKAEIGDFVAPLRDSKNQLQTDPVQILRAAKEHYQALAQDDPKGISLDDAHWADKDLGEPLPEMLKLNTDLRWPEVLVAIRAMNNGTAPGSCNMHVDLLKSLVKEESGLAAEKNIREEHNTNWTRPERVDINVPEKDLPTKPLTPLGSALFALLSLVWKTGVIPQQWHEVSIVNLPKPGAADPEDPASWRGISLISVSMKLLEGVMTTRLTKELEGKKKGESKLSEEQSGFRKGEECIAQFLTVTEILRRRHLYGLSTIGVFVDFKKAYDKVYHGALYRILGHMGVSGRFLRLIRNMYFGSRMRVRMGRYSSTSFTMKRGIRQGSPLSPLLFIIFVNYLFRECSAGGVGVPLGSGQWKNCAGGMYADDVIALEESSDAAARFCKKIYKWGQEWGMELGIKKCGVMCWTEDSWVRENHQRTRYLTPDGEIPKVDSYKYLGIVVNETWHKHREKLDEGRVNMELMHARYLANKGRKAMYSLRPLLSDPDCPIPLKAALIRTYIVSVMMYGAEWIGFKQVNVAPLQRVVNTAARWAVGLSAKSLLTDGFTLCYELGIPPMEVEVNAMRTRLYTKLVHTEKMRTFIRHLVGKGKHWHRPDANNLWDGKVHTQSDALQIETITEGPRRYPARVQSKGRTWLDTSELWITQYVEKGDLSKYETVQLDENAVRGREDIWLAQINVLKRAGILQTWRNPLEHDFTWPDRPLRQWATRGLAYEFDLRSNSYKGNWLQELHMALEGFYPSGHRLSSADFEALGIHEYEKGFTDPRLYSDRFIAGAERGLLRDAIVGGSKDAVVAGKVFDMRDVLLEREMTNNKSEDFKFYDLWGIGTTRGYLKTSIARPDLTEGVKWLLLIRTRNFPRVVDFWNRARKLGIEVAYDFNECPLCHSTAFGRDYIWAHLLMECTHADVQGRRRGLAGPISILRQALRDIIKPEDLGLVQLNAGLSDWTGLTGAIAIYLVGGTIGNTFGVVYHLGFGHTDFISFARGDVNERSEKESFGYGLISSFFKVVAPLYMKALGLDGIGFHLQVDDFEVEAERGRGVRRAAQGEESSPESTHSSAGE